MGAVTPLAPGSPAAILEGCTCGWLANNAGRGWPYTNDDGPAFVVSEDCPLHGEMVEEEE